MIAPILAALVIGTWNGNWFPSGRAEHRANPRTEAATAAAAARMLAAGFDALDPMRTNDVILVLNEMRGPRAASNLVAQIGRPGLALVSISGYRRRDRFDYQQDAIATTLPVTDRGWCSWKEVRRYQERPPRGYAYAQVVVEPSVTAKVYAVHLKSNYGATAPETVALNRVKRQHAAEQLCAQTGRSAYVVIAGDFNADPWRTEFAEETLFKLFQKSGYDDLLAQLPPERRGTFAQRRFGDSALDHVLVKGFLSVVRPHIEPNDGLSDHFALMTVVTPAPHRGVGSRANRIE